MTAPPAGEFHALQAALRGRYVLERELGRGGMGVVLLARDVGLDRPVAIKLLPPALAAVPDLRHRFLQEARTAAGLSHPHIVPIHAVEDQGDLVCFVMAYVPGESLAARVRDAGPLEPAAAARLVQEVAWALAYAHQHGVVHRDVKPENILLEHGSGRALVTDFGIARLLAEQRGTPPGEMLGTPRMVSPEQAAGEAVDGRSDLYSLGITAYFALTGRYPFEGDSAGALLAQHLTVPAPPVAALRAGVPPALARAIDRCLAKRPEERFPDGEALARAVAETPALAPVPRALSRLTSEVSSLAMDLVSFGTLAVVAVASYALTPRDFLGFGLVYTVGLTAVLASVAAIRGLHLGRLTRDAVLEGWGHADLAAAAGREAREEGSRLGSGSTVRREAALYLAGLAALVLLWAGPREWVWAHMEGPLAWLLELVSLALPVALGRWFGLALEAPREGRPGLITRFFLGVKSGLLFRMMGGGPKRGAPRAVAADQPTALVLAGAARELLRALPPAARERVDGSEAVLGRLERNAELLYARLTELDRAAGDVGGAGTPGRRAVGAEIAEARAEAAARLGVTVSALETLRLELLRARAGLAGRDGLTGDLAALRELTDRIDGALDADMKHER